MAFGLLFPVFMIFMIINKDETFELADLPEVTGILLLFTGMATLGIHLPLSQAQRQEHRNRLHGSLPILPRIRLKAAFWMQILMFLPATLAIVSVGLMLNRINPEISPMIAPGLIALEVLFVMLIWLIGESFLHKSAVTEQISFMVMVSVLIALVGLFQVFTGWIALLTNPWITILGIGGGCLIAIRVARMMVERER